MANKDFIVKNGLIVGGNQVITSSGVIDSALAATTQSASDNTTKLATTAYVTTAVANLVDSSPSTLNTLNELAAALGDDANYATTTTNALAAKAPLASPTFTSNINGGDGVELRLGDSQDILFKHHASGYGHLENKTGNLYIDSETIQIRTDIDSLDTAVYIDASHNVGIRDTAPQDYLEINGSGSGLGGLTISNSTHNHAALSFARSAAATARIYIHEPGATHTSALAFQTSNASGSSPNLVTAVTIDENQDVGIGDTSPDVRLHVNQSGEPPAEGMFILEANSSSRQLRIQPPTNADNGFIDYRGGNLLFLDDGSEVLRLAASRVSINHQSNTWGRLNVHENSATVSSLVLSQGSSSGNALEINDGNTDQSGNLFVVTGGGKVGIGTPTTDGLLAIKGTGAYFDADSATNNNAGMRLYENGTFKWQLYNDGDASDVFKIDTSSANAITVSQGGSLTVNRATNSSAANLGETVSEMTARFRHRASVDSNLWIGNVANGITYLQGANDAGDGTVDMTMQPFGGKVGIGTTAPSKQLTVSGADAEFLLSRTGSYADTITMGMPSGVPTIVGGTDLAFGGTGTWTEHMRIASDGAVTLKPVGITTGLRLQGRSSDNHFYVQWKSNDGSSNYGSIGSLNSGGLQYQTNTHIFQNEASNTEYMRINSTGVGIGGSPGAKLDVNSGTTNTMAHFHSTDDNGFIELKDDDTTGYIGVQNDYLYIGGAPSTSTQNLVINDGTGNVGIGTTSPFSTAKLHLKTSNGIPANSGTTQGNSALSFEGQPGIRMDMGSNYYYSNAVWMQTGNTTDLSAKYAITLNPKGGASSANGGAVGIANQGATPTASNAGFMFSADQFYTATTSTSANTQVRFINGNGLVGNVTTSGSSTAFNTSSDYRLKENVDYTWDATTRLKQLKPARFNWIVDDTNTLVDGFLAHEVSSIVPEAITGEKDGMSDPVLWKEEDNIPDGKSVGDVRTVSEPEYQQMDHSKLVPLLVKTIQELEARITILEG